MVAVVVVMVVGVVVVWVNGYVTDFTLRSGNG